MVRYLSDHIFNSSYNIKLIIQNHNVKQLLNTLNRFNHSKDKKNIINLAIEKIYQELKILNKIKQNQINWLYSKINKKREYDRQYKIYNKSIKILIICFNYVGYSYINSIKWKITPIFEIREILKYYTYTQLDIFDVGFNIDKNNVFNMDPIDYYHLRKYFINFTLHKQKFHYNSAELYKIYILITNILPKYLIKDLIRIVINYYP